MCGEGGTERAERYKETSKGVWRTEEEERGETRYQRRKKKAFIQERKTTADTQGRIVMINILM